MPCSRSRCVLAGSWSFLSPLSRGRCVWLRVIALRKIVLNLFSHDRSRTEVQIEARLQLERITEGEGVVGVCGLDCASATANCAPECAAFDADVKFTLIPGVALFGGTEQ